MNNDTRYMLTVLEVTREQVTALVDHLNRVQEYVAEQRAGSDIVQLACVPCFFILRGHGISVQNCLLALNFGGGLLPPEC